MSILVPFRFVINLPTSSPDSACLPMRVADQDLRDAVI
jgi:hypothetical protein